jgi:hypothetical protein
MKPLLLVILSVLLWCSAFGETTFRIQKHGLAVPDTLRLDTTKQMIIAELIGLPASIILVSCELVYASKREILKEPYKGNGFSKLSENIWYMLKRAQRGDELELDDIIVMKDGKKLRWPTRTYIIY